MNNYLKVGSTSDTMTLTPETSDVSSNVVIPKVVSLNQTSATYTESMITNSGSNSTYLYNWHAALGFSSGTTVYGVGSANTSICPKNWRLPDGGSYSFVALAKKYGLENENPASQNSMNTLRNFFNLYPTGLGVDAGQLLYDTSAYVMYGYSNGTNHVIGSHLHYASSSISFSNATSSQHRMAVRCVAR